MYIGYKVETPCFHFRNEVGLEQLGFVIHVSAFRGQEAVIIPDCADGLHHAVQPQEEEQD